MNLVWYAAYGSNMSRERFSCYLGGGTPSGGHHACPGCRSSTEPEDERAWEIVPRLVFGGTSLTWGGGVAFVAPADADPPSTKARLYLITLAQFEDVVAQENWLPPGSVSLGDAALHTEFVVDPGHTYGTVLRLGELEDVPVLTFTQRRGTLPAKPSPAYLRHIASGLRESHAMTTEAIAAYLLSKEGVEGAFTADELARIVDRTEGRPIGPGGGQRRRPTRK